MPTDDLDEIPHPRANPDLIGHEAAERALRSAVDDGRLHHAWLITGPKGIGKATLAYRFARYVLAHPGETAEAGLFGADELTPPGEAGSLYVDPAEPVFQRVENASHADMLTIRRTENDRGKLRAEIVVDDVRNSQSLFRQTAGEGGWRVIIVDAADEMNPNAANALLKMLEEPPARALLLLICHNPARLLPTIRSRCQKLRLEALPAETVTMLLRRFIPDLPDMDAELAAALAEGSIGRAMTLAASGGLEVYGQVMDLLDDLPQLDVTKLHGFATSCGGVKGADTFVAAAELIRWTLARLVRYAGGGTETFTDGLAAREAALFARLGPAAGLESWLGVWEKTDALLDSAARANLDRKQVILNTFSVVERAVQ